MPTSLITVGTNSYISLTDAETYFSGRLYTTNWDSATTTQKEKALITACKLIENIPFIGYKYITTQTLQFPRNFQTSVPSDVKEAQCEEALAILGLSETEFEEIENTNLKKVTIGSVSEEYFGMPNKSPSSVYCILKSKYSIILLDKYTEKTVFLI